MLSYRCMGLLFCFIGLITTHVIARRPCLILNKFLKLFLIGVDKLFRNRAVNEVVLDIFAGKLNLSVNILELSLAA